MFTKGILLKNRFLMKPRALVKKRTDFGTGNF